MQDGRARAASRWPSRRSLLALALAVLIAGSGLVVAFGWKHLQGSAPLLRPEAMTVAPGIHLLGGLSPSAVYVIETSWGPVLIDSGLESDAMPVKAEMAKLGLDWKRVRAVLLTHVHGDHSGGAEYFRTTTGATIYAGQGDSSVLRAGRPREAFFSTYYMPQHTPHATTVDVELKGDELIELAGVRLRTLATPGHTPGSICYLLERGRERVLFAGDIIMMLRGDENPQSEPGKPLGTYSAYLAPRYRGNAQDLLATLRRLHRLPVPDLVLPGHPSADREPQSPHLSQDRWESLLDSGIHDMETLLARYQKDGANFLDGGPKRLLPDLFYLGDFKGCAVYGMFSASKLTLVDAPGGPGLLEFVSDRLRQLGLEPARPAAVLLTSCDVEATAGLKELVEQSRCEVVASAPGMKALKESFPPETRFLSTEEFSNQQRLPLTPIPLRGRGTAATAYLLQWRGKLVLFSGRIPIKVEQEAGEALFADFRNARGNIPDYLESLKILSSVKPDLWLPAVPSQGQNTNLYDQQWDQLLRENLEAIQINVRASRRAGG
jgi:glyoxylase-like metal-dependent hydrolase (beta-lactamase superfamily II)